MLMCLSRWKISSIEVYSIQITVSGFDYHLLEKCRCQRVAFSPMGVNSEIYMRTLIAWFSATP